MRNTVSSVLVAIGLCALSGCGGDGGTPDAWASPVVATPAPAATVQELERTTTVAPSTTAVTSVSSSTSSATAPTTGASLVAPTTSIDENGELYVELSEFPPVSAPQPRGELDAPSLAFVDNVRAIYRCLVTPATCDLETVTMPGSPAADYYRRLLDRYLDNGWELRLRLEYSSEVVMSSALAADGGSALLEVCVTDANEIVIPNGDVEGMETVVNFNTDVHHRLIEMRTDTDGTWRLWALENLLTSPAPWSCES